MSLYGIALVNLLALSSALPNRHAAVRTLYQYPEGTFLENIAIRANGDLLVTHIDAAEIHALRPSNTDSIPEVVVALNDVSSIFGIAEIEPDVFAFAADNFTLVDGGEPGSWSVRTLVLTSGYPKVTHVADIPNATFLNGMTVLPATTEPHDVLVGDIDAEFIYRVRPSTGTVDVAVKDSLTRPVDDVVFGRSGVNGFHIHPDQPESLYLANTGQHVLARLPVDPLSGEPVAGGKILSNVTASPLTFTYDDFALPGDLELDPSVYMVTGAENSVERVSLHPSDSGSREVVAGNLNSTLIAGPTSAAFGRTGPEAGVLYVVTSGGIPAPIMGENVVGAQILALYLKPSYS